jgi:hypothetical protein
MKIWWVAECWIVYSGVDLLRWHMFYNYVAQILRTYYYEGTVIQRLILLRQTEICFLDNSPILFRNGGYTRFDSEQEWCVSVLRIFMYKYCYVIIVFVDCHRTVSTSSSSYFEDCKDLGVYNLENNQVTKRCRYLYPDTKVLDTFFYSI